MHDKYYLVGGICLVCV